jgi:hypothetical protein
MEYKITPLWETFDYEVDRKDGLCSSATFKYLVENVFDEIEAVQAINDDESGTVPGNVNGAPMKSIAISERVNETTYKVDVNYARENTSGGGGSNNDDDGDEDPTMAFDCSTGNVTKSFAIKQTPLGGSADIGLVINWNGKVGSDSEIKGVEIVFPQSRETWTKAISRDKAESTNFKRKIAELTGKVNSKKFKGWSPGEVLFLGASFTADESKSKTVVTYNFAISFNEKMNAGGKNYDKKGHEYIWSITENIYDDKIKKNTVKTTGSYLAQVYEYADLNELGI